MGFNDRGRGGFGSGNRGGSQRGGSSRRGSDDRRGGNGDRFGNNNRFGAGNRSFNDRPKEMHKTTCADCKCDCEVPFKPSGDRPVYCKDCFAKHKPSRY